MSEENVEIARAAIEATLRRPKPDYEAMNALIHPDHEFLAALRGGSEEVEVTGERRAGANSRPAWRRPSSGR
jgi:hypothetical protein